MPPQKTVVTVLSKISDRPVAKQACLVVIYGLDLGRKHELYAGHTIIGRSGKADIQVDQESVSRSHARISAEIDRFVIADLGSTNGTYVNDRAVDERVLRDGDLVKIGRTIFKFLSGSNIENDYHEEIYRLTTMDGLTQIHNKRYFMEAMDREISRCRRYGRELSLVMFDLDHFKDVNDGYGHLAGDYVLETVAEVIRERIRREDVLARYGGEEFSVVLPEVDLEGAARFAEKIRALVEAHPFTFDEVDIPLTISLGVASLADGPASSEDFIRLADERLYRAKASGRNRVVAR